MGLGALQNRQDLQQDRTAQEANLKDSVAVA